MVSRLLNSINGIFSRGASQDEKSDLDEELQHLDKKEESLINETGQLTLINNPTPKTGPISPRHESKPEVTHNIDDNDHSADHSWSGSPAMKLSSTSVSSGPVTPPTFDDLVILGPKPISMSKSKVSMGGPQMTSARPVTRRAEILETPHKLSDVSPIPVGLVAKKKRSTSAHLYKVPCEITSQGKFQIGPKSNINVDSHSNVPITVNVMGAPRPATANERIIYGMSEMQDFVSRPTSTPEFLELSMMGLPQKSNKNSKAEAFVKGKVSGPQSPSKADPQLKSIIKTNRSSSASKRAYSVNQVTPSRKSLSASSQHSTMRPSSPHRQIGHRDRSNSLSREMAVPRPNVSYKTDANRDEHVNSEWKQNNSRHQYQNPSYRLVSTKSSSSILQSLNENINAIMIEEDEEFRDKYSQWIAEIFHTQLSKMKSKLTDQFNWRLEDIHKEKDREIAILQDRYQSKLNDFDGVSTKFQKWVDELEVENRRIVAQKDGEIEQMKMQIEEAEQNFELRLEKQQSQLKGEAEHEKMELVNRHEESVRKLLGSRGRMDPMVKSQVESLHRLVSSLKSENTNLKRNLKDLSTQRNPRHGNGTTTLDFDTISVDETQLDAFSSTIEQLSKKLNETEREKTAISELHADEIRELKKLNEDASIDMVKQLQKAQDTIQHLKKMHDREIKDLKMTMLNQETKYNKTFVELKRNYGQKIENLTKTIDKIQSEFS